MPSGVRGYSTLVVIGRGYDELSYADAGSGLDQVEHTVASWFLALTYGGGDTCR